MAKKYLIGLGNPGPKYAQTRHNAGWLFLDFLTEKFSLAPFQMNQKLQAEVSENPSVMLLKPQTFMNESGQTARQLARYYPVRSESEEGYQNVFVIHDDLDLELGNFRIQFGSGPKIHNGVNSVREAIGSEFWTVRIGVDSRSGDRSIPGHEYVLQRLSDKEQDKFRQVFQQMYEQIEERKLLEF